METLIIGCGIAGASAALRLSDAPSQQITIITRAPDPEDSNTNWAQGGIVTRGLDDDPALLVEDILRAGAGLSSRQAAYVLATEGPKLVQSVLVETCGVEFDRTDDGNLVYGLEGAHSRRRVVHKGDKTGAVIARQLLLTLQERPNITLLTDHTAVDLIVHEGHSVGATVLNRQTGDIEPVLAHHTILATGGVGQLFRNTTNPAGARGDGVAMAMRADAQIANAEYVQFHPTAMYVDEHPFPLVSEAVRGEGAILLTPDDRRFMVNVDPEWKELAPRDVVARAIYSEMKLNGYDHVWLDIASQCSPDYIRERFPQLVENCEKAGIDPTRDPIPVVPAAHYFCGGVSVDLWGQSSLEGLYAVGEVSCTGLHGANRLASTSLLEGLVWGDRAARDILSRPAYSLPRIIPPVVADATPEFDIHQMMGFLQNLMWEHVGLMRDENGLRQAHQQIQWLRKQVEKQYRYSTPTDALIGLRNAVQVAGLITESALLNQTSTGAHYRTDAVMERLHVS
jgi:L-aspartate oxidase